MFDAGKKARVIVEDDAVLSYNFANLLAALPDHLPRNWKIIRLTHLPPWPAMAIGAAFARFRVGEYTRMPIGFYGYMVNRRFAECFVRFRNRRYSIDPEMACPHWFGDFMTYGVIPSPVTVSGDLSVIDRMSEEFEARPRKHLPWDLRY